MKQIMADQASHIARDYFSLFLAGMGISFAPHEYFGGLFMALACASVMARHRKDPRKHWLVLLTAFLFATLIAVWLGDTQQIKIQLIMAVSGLASGWVMNSAMKFFDRIEERASDAADKVVDKVLPGGDK